MHFPLRAHTHLLTVAGSRAYGLHRSTSDVDLKGVAVPPKATYLGFATRWEHTDDAAQIAVFGDLLSDEERVVVADTKLEGTVYELRKFLALAAECNPNILDVLFCRDADVRWCTPLGESLRAHRHLVLSARAKHTFSGYALAQLKRIKGHRAWLIDPPKAAPTRADFGLPDETLIPGEQLAAAEAAIRKEVGRWEIDWTGVPDAEVLHVQAHIAKYLGTVTASLGLGSNDDTRWLAAARSIGLHDNLILVLQREREYGAARARWFQYQTWRTERNEARASLEAQFGYDTKHAAHLVRLLRMGREILETGQVNVWRGDRDADELLAIRSGAWSYDQLVAWAEAEDAALTELYNARRYVVPRQPDRQALDTLCVTWVEGALREAAAT